MLYATPLVTAYALAVTALFGLVMGSFLNCWAWRIANGESILRGRSHCTTCGHVLGALDLIPIVGYIAGRGRCRYCDERISWRYPATELLCAVVYTSIVARYGLTLEALELVAFASVLLVLSLTDIDKYLIPNGCIAAAAVIRVLYIAGVCIAGAAGMPAEFISPHAEALVSQSWLESVPADASALSARSAAAAPVGADAWQRIAIESAIGAVVVLVPLVVLVLVMDIVLRRPSMGGGDLKLFAVAGFYFGWQQTLLLVIVACVIGIVVAYAGGRPQQSSDPDSPQDGVHRVIPFGPSIALACWATMLCGQQAVGAYLGLF